MKRLRRLLTVSVCINDPANGLETGHVSGCHVQDEDNEMIELEGCYLYNSDNPTCRINVAAGKMRVGRRVFPISGYRQWYGNWCWDAVGMTRGDARSLIAHLLSRGFTIGGGPEVSDLLPAEEAAS